MKNELTMAHYSHPPLRELATGGLPPPQQGNHQQEGFPSQSIRSLLQGATLTGYPTTTKFRENGTRCTFVPRPSAQRPRSRSQVRDVRHRPGAMCGLEHQGSGRLQDVGRLHIGPQVALKLVGKPLLKSCHTSKSRMPQIKEENQRNAVRGIIKTNDSTIVGRRTQPFLGEQTPPLAGAKRCAKGRS